MSKYTTTVREICESFLTEDEKYQDLPVYNVIEKTKERFFNFTFPWYSNTKDGKSDFMTAFLERYYNDYIGFETFGMWKTYFSAKMSAVMPYYKKLYSALSSGDDPFYNVDVHHDTNEKETRDTSDSYNDTAVSNTQTDTNTQDIHSDNPQVTVATNDYASTMDRGEGVTNSHGTGDTSHIGNENVDRERGEQRHEYGIRGKTRAQLIDEYRGQIVNINKELIDMCSTLFLGVW